jgi:hypothetical protein
VRCAVDAQNGHHEYCHQPVAEVSIGRKADQEACPNAGKYRLAGGVRSPPSRLRSRRMRVRVPSVRMHDPTLRPPAAHDAAQKHLAAIARDGVVVPGHITVNPAPHRVTFQNTNGRRVARAMPCARAPALHENVRRIESRRFVQGFARGIAAPKLHVELRFRKRVSERVYFLKSTNAIAGAVALTVTVT